MAKRKDGTAIFPEESQGHKYYVEQVATQLTAGLGKTATSSTMQIEWNNSLMANSHTQHVRLAMMHLPFGTIQVLRNAFFLEI